MLEQRPFFIHPPLQVTRLERLFAWLTKAYPLFVSFFFIFLGAALKQADDESWLLIIFIFLIPAAILLFLTYLLDKHCQRKQQQRVGIVHIQFMQAMRDGAWQGYRMCDTCVSAMELASWAFVDERAVGKFYNAMPDVKKYVGQGDPLSFDFEQIL